jgi:hypothetical protein
VAVLCGTLDEVRELSARAVELAPSLGAVLAPYIPSALVALFSAAGIAAIRLDAGAAGGLKGQRTITLPAPSEWAEGGPTKVVVGSAKLPLTWLALAPERAWVTGEVDAQASRSKDAQASRSKDAQASRLVDAPASRLVDAPASRLKDAPASRVKDPKAPQAAGAKAPSAARTSPVGPGASVSPANDAKPSPPTDAKAARTHTAEGRVRSSADR